MVSGNPSTASSTMAAEEREAYIRAQQLSTLSAMPMVLNAVIELGVLNVLVDSVPAGTHLSPQEIFSKLELEKSHPDSPAMLDRMLYLLASHEVLSCTLDTDGGKDGAPMTPLKRYGAKPVCRYLTKIEDYVPLSTFIHDRVNVEFWHHIKDAVLDGEVAFHKAHGTSVFDYAEKDPRYTGVYKSALAVASAKHMKLFLPSYAGFEGVGTLVDVGGGDGASLRAIVSRHPTIKGINFELPHVVADAPALHGVEHVGGDMFERVPSGDAMFLKHILHTWSDEHCLKLLEKCREALPEKGKAVVIDAIIPEKPDSRLATKFALHMDVLMMANFPGGRERTEKEFESLARKAGFSDFKVACDLGDVSVMEFIK